MSRSATTAAETADSSVRSSVPLLRVWGGRLQIHHSYVRCDAFALVAFWDLLAFGCPFSSSVNRTDPSLTEHCYIKHFWCTRWSSRLCRGRSLSGKPVVFPLSCAKSSSVSECMAAKDDSCLRSRTRFRCICAIAATYITFHFWT